MAINNAPIAVNGRTDRAGGPDISYHVPAVLARGLRKPTAGSATILGHDIQHEPVAAKAQFGYVPDTPNLYGKLSGWEFLRFMARLYRVPTAQGEHRASELLRLFDL